MSNELIHESSPYLLQHAENPVNWFAWNEKTLQKARKENKMLLISIGYAACHWCHVMERESFEKEDVAEIMNSNYICIKVDREERPDVDQIYMNAAMLINGNGGWPLNAFAMPDGKPFFAGTYFPKERWIKVLEYFSNIFKTEPEKLRQQADNISQGIHEMEYIPKKEDPGAITQEGLDNIAERIYDRIDLKFGGTKGQIKFPMPSVWEFLLMYSSKTNNSQILKAVQTTLHNMMLGGIYDHVGGGFARYSTDPKWHVPHFEKMLYDNAQLVSLYSHAFQVTKNPFYKKVVYETLEFVERELTSPEGGFYSSIDADSEHEEGKYYVWTDEEINEVLGSDAEFYKKYYAISKEGNWEEGKNIPDALMGKELLTANEHLLNNLISLNKKLRKHREKRIRPATDDKILTSWNCLMAKGYIDAGKAFEEQKFLDAAKQNLDFLIKNQLSKSFSVFRNYKNGKSSVNGFLDDYAFFISALIEYYQVSFEELYLEQAKKLCEYSIDHFFDPKSGMFFYTDKDYSNLILRTMEVTDNVIPSSNSEMAKVLLWLSKYFEEKDFESKSKQLVDNIYSDAAKNPYYYSNWAQAILLQMLPDTEIAITGKNWKEMLKELQKFNLPGVLYSGGETEGSLPLIENKVVKGKTLIFVCKNKTCKLPVENVRDALKEMQSD